MGDFVGETEADGELYNIAGIQKDLNKMTDKERSDLKKKQQKDRTVRVSNKPRRPFKAYLDVGLVRTTTGNRVFGAMKGACDGGLNIPHKDKRFPGFHITKAEVVTNKRGKAAEIEKAKQTFDPKEHREHIFGGHVEKYYKSLKTENAQKFNKQFSKWEKALGKDSFEALYKKVHASIRANPARKSTPSKGTHSVAKSHVGYNIMKSCKGKGTWLAYRRLTHAERKDRVAAKMLMIQQAAME